MASGVPRVVSPIKGFAGASNSNPGGVPDQAHAKDLAQQADDGKGANASSASQLQRQLRELLCEVRNQGNAAAETLPKLQEIAQRTEVRDLVQQNARLLGGAASPPVGTSSLQDGRVSPPASASPIMAAASPGYGPLPPAASPVYGGFGFRTSGNADMTGARGASPAARLPGDRGDGSLLGMPSSLQGSQGSQSLDAVSRAVRALECKVQEILTDLSTQAARIASLEERNTRNLQRQNHAVRHLQEQHEELRGLVQRRAPEIHSADVGDGRPLTTAKVEENQFVLKDLREERLQVAEMLDNIRTEKLEVITIMHGFQVNKDLAIREIKDVHHAAMEAAKEASTSSKAASPKGLEKVPGYDSMPLSGRQLGANGSQKAMAEGLASSHSIGSLLASGVAPQGLRPPEAAPPGSSGFMRAASNGGLGVGAGGGEEGRPSEAGVDPAAVAAWKANAAVVPHAQSNAGSCGGNRQAASPASRFQQMPRHQASSAAAPSPPAGGPPRSPLQLGNPSPPSTQDISGARRAASPPTSSYNQTLQRQVSSVKSNVGAAASPRAR